MRAPLALALVALSLCGCSRMELAWSFAPWLAKREAQKYLHLPSKEEALLDEQLKILLDRFALEDAPLYARLALDLAGQVEAGQQQAAWDLAWKDGTGHWKRVTHLVIQSAGPLLATQDPERIEGLRHEFEKRNLKEFTRVETEAVSGSARVRLERADKSMQEWFGDLTPAQRLSLSDFHTRNAYPWQLWKQERLRRQGLLLAALPLGAEAVQACLRDWWQEPEKTRGPGVQKAFDDYKQAATRFYLGFFLGLEPAQRTVFAGKLRGWARGLEAIAAKAAPKKG